MLSVAVGGVAAGASWGGLSITLGRGSDFNPEFYSLFFSGFRATMTGLAAACGSVIVLLATLLGRGPMRTRVLVGGFLGLTTFLLLFSWVFFLASMPAISDVSLCFALRPWWRLGNWLFALIPASILAAGCTGILRAAHAPRSGWRRGGRAMAERGDDKLFDGDAAPQTSWDKDE